MPTPREILEGVTAIANAWRPLAIAWHGAAAAAFVAWLIGWRPSGRLAAALLVLPLASVSGAAWYSGNPFNGAVFATAAVALGAVAGRLPREPVRATGRALQPVAAALVVFAWVYPHFLIADSPIDYLFAAPLGVIPCPTLALLVGVSILTGGFSTAWTTIVSTLAVAYGAIGAIRLGVTMDVVLLAGGVVLAVQRFAARQRLAAA
jgi:hypothetical protein